MAKVLNNTTLGAPLDRHGRTVKLASTVNVAIGMLMVIEREAMLVQRILPDLLVVEVQRGHGSTTAVRHAAGAVAWVDEFKYFSSAPPEGEAVEAEQPALPRIVLPGIFPRLTAWQVVNGSWVEVPTEALVNYYVVDPRSGGEYLRVQASAAVANANRWVVVLYTGQAATMVAASVGRFGINDAAKADEEYFFVQTGGFFQSPGVSTTQFILAAGLLTRPLTPAADGQMTDGGTSADTKVFGLELVRRATATVSARAFLTRPHSIGTSVDNA